MTAKKRGKPAALVFGTRWSAEDIRYLREHAGKISADDIATHLGRTRIALRFRANLLKISLIARDTLWSAADIRYLQQHAGRMEAAAIAKHLGRTLPALRFKAASLKVSLAPPRR